MPSVFSRLFGKPPSTAANPPRRGDAAGTERAPVAPPGNPDENDAFARWVIDHVYQPRQNDAIDYCSSVGSAVCGAPRRDDTASVSSSAVSGAGPLPLGVKRLRNQLIKRHGTDRAALDQLLVALTGMLKCPHDVLSSTTDSALASRTFSCLIDLVRDVDVEPGFVNQYLLVQQLGSGQQGEVWEATNTETGEARAIKIVPRGTGISRIDQQARRHAVENEMQALATCRSRHVLRLYEVIDSPEHPNVYFVTALCDGIVASIDAEGTVQKKRTPGARFYLEEVTSIALHIAAGVVYLHERGIAHRDIKPDNLLSLGSVYCIGDLGACTRFVRGNQRSTDCSLHDLVRQRLPRGTDAFQPPSRLGNGANELERLQRADIWALGVTLKSLLDGRLPYAVDGDLGEQIEQADFGFNVETPSLQQLRACARQAAGRAAEPAAAGSSARQSHVPAARLLWGDLLRTMLSADGQRSVSAIEVYMRVKEISVALFGSAPSSEVEDSWRIDVDPPEVANGASSFLSNGSEVSISLSGNDLAPDFRRCSWPVALPRIPTQSPGQMEAHCDDESGASTPL